MNHDAHLGDDLEAYALGMLEANEGAVVEAHVATCEPCLQRLALAESGVASMLALEARSYPSQTTARKKPFPRLAIAATIAAAFVILTVARIVSLERALGGDGLIVSAMIASHFGHAQFRTPVGRPFDAKVLYDRDSRWYVIIARDTSLRLAVAARHGEASHEVAGRFEPRGDAAIVRLTPPAALVRFELRDTRDRIVGTVALPRAP